MGSKKKVSKLRKKKKVAVKALPVVSALASVKGFLASRTNEEIAVGVVVILFSLYLATLLG